MKTPGSSEGFLKVPALPCERRDFKGKRDASLPGVHMPQDLEVWRYALAGEAGTPPRKDLHLTSYQGRLGGNPLQKRQAKL